MKQKLIIPSFSSPSCFGCEFYVDNREEKTYVGKACGRTLYRGEQYCIFGPRAIRFRRSWPSAVYPQCPRKLLHLDIHIYVKSFAARYRDEYDRLGKGGEYPDAADYIYCRTTTTALTSKKFFLELHKGDIYDLLGYSPEPFDMLELDNGVTSDFLVLRPSRMWEIVYPEKKKIQTGQTGDFRILCYEQWDIDRYQDCSKAAKSCCIGYVCGHFGPGMLVTNWVDICGQQDNADLADLEKLIETLKSGFLRNVKELHNYCLDRSWAILPNSGNKEWGFYTAGEKATYYLKLLPGEESPYNVYIYCYTQARQ